MSVNPPARPAAGRLHPAFGWVRAILLTVFAIAPLTYPGFFQAQSGFLPAFNAEHLSEAP